MSLTATLTSRDLPVQRALAIHLPEQLVTVRRHLYGDTGEHCLSDSFA